MNLYVFIGLAAGGFVFFIIIILIIMSKFLKIVEPGKALIIISPFGKSGPKVSFSGGYVFPIIHRMEVMDVSTKVMTVTRKGTDGLICKDNIRADLTVHFYIRVNNNAEDVRQVATSIGCKRASEHETLNELFQAKFSEALKTVGKQMDYAELFQERSKFKEEIIKTIGKDLNGYKLEDTAIDYLSQTSITAMDPNDIMDAEGIKKITELTSLQAIRTNEITQEKSEVMTKRNVEAKERILELEKQQAEAEAKQLAEIDIIKAREDAEKNRVIQVERLKAESARINSDEQLEIAEANKNREIEIANKNKERAVILEDERIEKERLLEVTERDKVVSLATIEKEKILEEEKKKIQDIIRQRVSVERNVAEEKEKTNDLIALAGAERQKKVTIIAAEKEAEQNFIIDIKSAEAKEKAAMHTAKEKEILAEVEKSTAVKISEAKEILAVGVIAEESAKGLAEVKVDEAAAEAIKKKGIAEAIAKKELTEVEANATLLMGKSEAESLRLKYEAEAQALLKKYEAEAQGIKDKAESMKIYDDVGRVHEEFKLKLAYEEKITLEQIKIQKEIAQAQAEVISSALKSAHIDIVGGETQFFDKLVSSIVEGKSKNAFVKNNEYLVEFKDALLRPGDDNLIKRLKKIADDVGLTSEAVRDLTVSALINRIMNNTKNKNLLDQMGGIMKMVESMGLGDLIVNLGDF